MILIRVRLVMNSFGKKYLRNIVSLLSVLVLTLLILFYKSFGIYRSILIWAEIVTFFLSISFISNQFLRAFVWTAYCLIIAAQMSSIINTGGYIIPLTLSNLSEFKAVGHEVLTQVLFILLLYVLASIPFYFVKRTSAFKLSLLSFVIFIFMAGALHQFFNTAHEYYKQVTYKPNYNYPEVAKKFLKFNVYNESDMSLYFPNGKPKNIIVIFTEGMSSKVIDLENNLGLKITPNMDSLYNEGIVFENYFNHTAATFRGLRGQLSSAYQYRDGVDSKGEGFFQINSEKVSDTYNHRLISLPEILNDNGFNTYFIASTENHSNLNTLLRSMPFKKVYGMEDFDWHINDRMSDKKIFSALRTLVAEQTSKPFFIGMYPSGTHHGMDSPDQKYHNGSNSFYNKFYNYDFQLGDFITWFKKSHFYDNTLLIITADHSTFPVPDFKQSFNTSSDYFVDTIPLIMIGAGIKPMKLDAKGNNSLSIAPTILQILNIDNAPNYFLGCSLFDLKCTSKFSHISVIGDSYYRINLKTDANYSAEQIDSVPEVVDFYNVSG